LLFGWFFFILDFIGRLAIIGARAEVVSHFTMFATLCGKKGRLFSRYKLLCDPFLFFSVEYNP